jgi:hypothetical protein
MLDINKHKFYLVSVLKDIYADTELATALGFKGGTANFPFFLNEEFSQRTQRYFSVAGLA